MSEWLVGLLYLLGVLHAVPAWYFGKAAGLRTARTLLSEPPAVTVRLAHMEGTVPFVYIDPKDQSR